MSFDNTQPTSASGYNVKNMLFSKPRDFSIPNSTGGAGVSFKRVQIGTRNPDGTTGELMLQTTPRLFSFGLSPNVNMTTGKTDGYTLAMCLWNMDSPSSEEKQWTETFTNICDHACDYILEHRDEVEKYKLVKAHLDKFNPLYYKQVKGQIVEGAGPMLYAKVLQNKKNNTISSIFYDKYGRSIDPMTLLNKQCYVNSGLIKIEGIFIGSKVSLQVKLYEAEIEVKESGLKRLLRPSMENMVLQAPPMTAAVVSENVVENNDAEADNENDTGSIKGDDDDEVPVTPAAREPSPPPATAAASAKPRRIAKK
jgi:hypothetical protein